ncbi:DUF4381 domain-containing protein [Novipirellula artificiosorum]|uniref:DUF4381 domain-containing protein n=1 Tax=Novipirellula artificiosorum TaxID=2528016 RepID=A0A5C6E509_9BACT|nr:DUF4381 domain-containing protein [Novipirellula artificiosorum]TWU42671.1 hypothetical protein Poly41_09700 [Novipirellula artificiosorum]
MQPDPYSLDRLQDIVTSEPVRWWPPAPFGWFVIALLSLWGLILVAIRIHRWIFNAYRRQALRELTKLQCGQDRSLTKVSILLKRTALAAYPRGQVAALSGEEWTEFLRDACDHVSFHGGIMKQLGTASVQSENAPIAESDWLAVVDEARYWIKHHRGGEFVEEAR